MKRSLAFFFGGTTGCYEVLASADTHQRPAYGMHGGKAHYTENPAPRVRRHISWLCTYVAHQSNSISGKISKSNRHKYSGLRITYLKSYQTLEVFLNHFKHVKNTMMSDIAFLLFSMNKSKPLNLIVVLNLLYSSV